jgi:hypothetical protein
MKRYYAAAGALLLGTSALAWAGSADKTTIEPIVTSDAKLEMSSGKFVTTDAKPFLVADSDLNVKKQWTPVYATLDQDLAKLALAETGAKLQTASADSWSDTDSGAKIETAALEDKVVADADATFQTASVDKKTVETGMGGPLEEVAVSPAVVQPSNADPEHDARGIPVISDVAFVPPGFNGLGGAVGGPDEGGAESYPACTATVTDNCIQLYERGVRASLASAPTAKLEEESSTTAVGGPYEPVDADTTELAMNGDGDIDVAAGETTDGEIMVASADSGIATHSDYQGVGGPVEAQSGYPPCSPGPGDDRCIQLYEPGVTGAGN